MKYNYDSKTPEQIEVLADQLLSKYPACRTDGKPDIEKIIEHSQLRLIPRPNLSKLTCLDACLPQEDGIMIVDADLEKDLPIYKLTLAEEVSHRILEPELWTKGIPKGANLYELDPHVYDMIEGNAYKLALAILMPAKVFSERFQSIKTELTANKVNGELDALAIELLAKEFELTFNACVSRGRHLGVCNAKLKKKELPGAVVF